MEVIEVGVQVVHDDGVEVVELVEVVSVGKIKLGRWKESTRTDGYLGKRFCKMFPESSTSV